MTGRSLKANYSGNGNLAVKITVVNLCLALCLAILYVTYSMYSPQIILSTPNGKVPGHVKDKYTFSCKEDFNTTVPDNLFVVQNYPRGIADDYMWKIGGNMSTPNEMLKFPVFVTAFDWLYFPQSMGLFRSLHRYLVRNHKYGGFVQVIVYDLGLTTRQLKTLKTKCRCQIRKFPFGEFPSHVRNLKTYAFKPIIVQILLMEYGFVWWVDTSVRFTTNKLDSAINFATGNSILFYVQRDVSKTLTITRQTDKQTFEFLKEDRCKFRGLTESSATTALFHYDDITRAIVSAWAICALNEECIAPEGTNSKMVCHLDQLQDGRCHRFDQSVLSILTRRLYHDTNEYPLDRTLKDVFVIQRTYIDHYFESCRPILKCLT